MLVKKEKNKKRKLYHFTDLINDFNFYDYKFIKYEGFTGCLYALDEYKLNYDKLNEIETKYNNTKIITTYCEYAKEIKKTWLFISR
jgi:hypothetical protein